MVLSDRAQPRLSAAKAWRSQTHRHDLFLCSQAVRTPLGCTARTDALASFQRPPLNGRQGWKDFRPEQLAGRGGLGEARNHGGVVLVHQIRGGVVVARELADSGRDRNASLRGHIVSALAKNQPGSTKNRETSQRCGGPKAGLARQDTHLCATVYRSDVGPPGGRSHGGVREHESVGAPSEADGHTQCLLLSSWVEGHLRRNSYEVLSSELLPRRHAKYSAVGENKSSPATYQSAQLVKGLELHSATRVKPKLATVDHVGGVNWGVFHPSLLVGLYTLAGAKSSVAHPPKQARTGPHPAPLRSRAHAAQARRLRDITIFAWWASLVSEAKAK